MIVQGPSNLKRCKSKSLHYACGNEVNQTRSHPRLYVGRHWYDSEVGIWVYWPAFETYEGEQHTTWSSTPNPASFVMPESQASY